MVQNKGKKRHQDIKSHIAARSVYLAFVCYFGVFRSSASLSVRYLIQFIITMQFSQFEL